jgi:cold shock CspA family protein
MTGRIARITSGQGQGYIRDKDDRSVFFDRRDLVGVKFNDLAVGDAVAFELIEDQYSGPRGMQVRAVRQKPPKAKRAMSKKGPTPEGQK